MYEVGERILARTPRDVMFYDAKIVSIEKGEYTVHYQGWNTRYDEVINESELAVRTMKYSEEAHKKSKADFIAARNAKKSNINAIRSKKGKSLEGGKSRDTTPHSQANDGDSTVQSEASGKNEKTRPLKRKHDETIGSGKDVIGTKSEYPLALPNPLKNVLVEDFDLINRQYKIYTLPSKNPVASIIKQYLEELNLDKTNNDEVLIEYEEGRKIKHSSQDVIQSSKGILDYFDALLPMQLLYKYERPQYDAYNESKKVSSEPTTKKKRSTSAKEVTVEITKPKISEIYGIPHLLRLLTRFDNYLKQSKYDERIRTNIKDVVCDFIVWLNKNHTKYFNIADDYEVAPPEYQREAYT